MTNLYKNKITGEEKELTHFAFENLTPVYDRVSNTLLNNGGFVKLPNKPTNKKAKEIIKEANK